MRNLKITLVLVYYKKILLEQKIKTNNYINRFFLFILTFFLIAFQLLFSQTVYEPTYKDVYQYLDRFNNKGIIEFDNLVLPLSRDYIAAKLVELDSIKIKLTSLEKEELKFYFAEFGNEIEKIRLDLLGGIQKERNGKQKDLAVFEYTEFRRKAKANKFDYSLFEKDKYGRFRVFSYADDKVKLFVNPILGLEFTSWDEKNSNHIWNGVQFYGSFGTNFGFSMDFRDNTQTGEFKDPFRLFTPDQGIKKNGRNSFQFNNVNAMISYKWNWGSISAGKTPFEWGYASNGKIVHSSKAPSYPNIRLDLKVTNWLSFNYIYGWLNSEVIDSNEIYETFSTNPDWKRELYREKYFASHSLNIKPFKGLSLALGESIIISDRSALPYFIPIMFFRLADHYLSSINNDAGNNSQFFLSLSSRNHIPNTHFFATLFIDEIITGEILNSEKRKNQFGYTFGLSVVDLPIKNSDLKIEYSHINPFVYKHYIETQLYQNQGYNLGHWIGHNGDIFGISYSQRYIRGLSSKIWTQFIRKGEDGNADLMYKIPQPDFLFGLNTNYTYYGIDLRYEITHDLNIRAKYQYSSVETEFEVGKFIKENYNTFKFAVYYGL